MADVVKRTYETRLGCDNCGRAEAYTLPVRSIITSYDIEDHIPSSYHVGNRGEELIKCNHCRLPHLIVLWWKEEEVQVPVNGN